MSQNHEKTPSQKNSGPQGDSDRATVAGKSRYRLMVDNTSAPILLMDVETRIQYANQAAKRSMGLSPTQRIKRPVLDYIHQDDRNGLKGKLDDLIAKPDASFQAEFRFVRQGQEQRWVKCVALNKLDDPELKGILINFNDITGQKSAEESIQNEAARNQIRFQRNLELAKLSKLLAEIGPDYQSLLKTISRRVAELVNGGCSIAMLSEDGKLLEYIASHNVDREAHKV